MSTQVAGTALPGGGGTALTELEGTAVAELGGVATGPADGTVPLLARTYSHPALPGRTVVRLVPDGLTEAEDLSLDVLGLRAGGSVPVGHVRQRAVGFPAWPIIHDPANARHALNLVQDLRRAAKLAGSKPGRAKELLDGLAATLGASAPHFLPTFLEEAARVFLAHDNRTYAAQYFGKAREAERVHDLSVDEERHRQVLLEFALAGALGAKDLSEEAKALLRRTTPEHALETFLRLNVDRVRGGLPPYAGLAADVRRLARAAGADTAEVEERLLRELLGSAAVSSAPAGFWRHFIPVLVRLADQDPTVREWLLTTSPASVDSDDWVEVLEQTGLAQELRDGTQDAAAWATGHLRQLQARWDAGYPRRFSLLLRSCAGLAGRTVLLGEDVWRAEPEVLDALLEAGARVEVADDRRRPRQRRRRLDLRAWSEQEPRQDLAHLAADPELSAWAHEGVERLVSDGRLDALLEQPGTTRLLRAWAADGLGQEPTLGEVRNAVARVDRLWTDGGYAAAREELDALAARVDAPELLARALRQGLLTELTWPALERAADEVAVRAAPDATQPAPLVTTHEAWPAVGVSAGGLVVFVEGDDVVARAEFAPANGTEPESWQYILVDGSVGCLFKSRGWEHHLTWSTDPGTVHPHGYHYPHQDLSCTFAVPGGRLVGTAVQRAGARAAEFADRRSVLHDGTGYWVGHGSAMHEVDPSTGRLGRASLPAALADLVEDSLRQGWELDARHTSWHPATPVTSGSLVSTADGWHRWVTLHRDDQVRFLDADGAVIERDRQGDVLGRVRRPGGGHWLQGPRGLRDETTLAPLPEASDSLGRPHVLHRLTPVGWHHLRVRDEQVSARLRTMTPEQVAGLCAVVPPAAALDPDEDRWGGYGRRRSSRRADAAAPVDPLTDAARAAAETLLGTTDPALVDAVVWLAARVNHLVAHVEERRSSVAHVPRVDAAGAGAATSATGAGAAASGAGAVAGGAADGRSGTFGQWQPSQELVAGLSEHSRWRTDEASRADLMAAAALARGGSGTVQRAVEGLPLVVGHPDAVVALATAPLQPRADLEGAAAWLGAVHDAGLLAPGVTVLSLFRKNVSYGEGYEHGEVLNGPEGRLIVLGTGLDCPYGYSWAEYLALVTDSEPPATMHGRPTIVRARASGADPAPLLEAMTRLLDEGPPAWRPEAVEELAAGTGWSRAAAGIVLTGLRGIRRREKNFLPKEVRELLGLKVAEADGARQFLLGLPPELLTRMLAAGAADPVRAAVEGLDIAAMVEVWRAAGSASDAPALPDALRAELARVVDYPGPRAVDALLDPDFRPTRWPVADVGLPMLLWLAARLDRADPLRPWVAERLETMREEWRAHQFVHDVLDGAVRQALGMPARPAGDRQTDAWTQGAWSVWGMGQFDRVAWRPAEVTDWDRERTLVEAMGDDAPPQAHQVVALVGGSLDPLLADLRTPGEGAGQDPLVSAPEVVTQVAEELGLPQDAARYWLQLLALPDPTDKNVAAWNGWSSARRGAAAAPLLEKGLVMEARRARAGRGVFLPGGWLEATAPRLPMEVWKAPLFALHDQLRVSPTFGAVVPLVPLGQLFADAWDRYRTGDVPGYVELRTERYRRRN